MSFANFLEVLALFAVVANVIATTPTPTPTNAPTHAPTRSPTFAPTALPTSGVFGLGAICAPADRNKCLSGLYCDYPTGNTVVNGVCRVCPANSYCNSFPTNTDGVARACPAGWTSAVGSDAQTDCNPLGAACGGAAGNCDQSIASSFGSAYCNNGVCELCPADNWCAAGVKTACTGTKIIAAGSGRAAVDCNEAPTSAPTYTAEAWGQIVWDKRRNRNGGLCENHCSNHGTCEKNNNCKCFTGLDGEPDWTGPDCSLRTCPRDFAWVGDVINSNNLHPWVECSNKGSCDRKTGTCSCYPGYDGVACQRSTCPNNCNDRGTCWPEKHLAAKAGRRYDTPWDNMKHVGCFCDTGFRGPACELQECPSGTDPLDGYGNESGRDCSGRGLCNYGDGTCTCFSGFYGTHCQYQTTVF